MEDLLIKEFIAESLEGLDRTERSLAELEADPGKTALIAEIFRAVHTIKGTTGFLGFQRMEKLAHAGESLLSAMRDGLLVANEQIIEMLLEVVDVFRIVLNLIETTGSEGERREDDDAPLIQRMRTLVPVRGSAARPKAVPSPAAAAAGEATTAPAPAAAAPAETHNPRTLVADKSLRIDVEVLNRMMNLVGELVLTRNQILQSNLTKENFSILTRRLDAVTADLRETVMQARMQPVGQLFGQFPRMVRDLAKACGKNVRVELTGQETGLDKSLLEAIKDPLVHALRNAIDHGLETSEVRIAKGKPAHGLLRLRAFHQSGSVVIEVSDDGAGVAKDKVIARAIERGLITEQRAASMSSAETLELLFLPGFSTAEAVTNLSGRGVGMDVVRLNVEHVGGTVEMESQPGVGTTLRMKVPLTMAIVPSLIVRSGDQSFCLPQSALAELIYLSSAEQAQAFGSIGDAQVYPLRDALLPVVVLDRILRQEPVQTVQQDAEAGRGCYLAVLESDGCRYGLLVDDLLAPEEIVVKPLSAVLREIGLFSGATVLGNGTLALILDVAATAERAGVLAVRKQASIEAPAPVESSKANASFLIFEGMSQGGHIERTALPLEAVERIETVPLRQIEFADGSPLLRYRGELLLLEDTERLLDERTGDAEDATVTVLICLRPSTSSQPSRRIGMVIREVLDVSSGQLLEDDPSVSVKRLAVVNDRLTNLHEDFRPQTPRWGAAA